MFRPDDEDKPFIARWNMLARILLVESSVKLVARAAMDYADFDDGSSCHPSNERIGRETGYNEKTVRIAWSVMRGLGMAERVAYGVAHRRLADEYQLRIPDNWINMPVLGPHGGKFRCLACGKLFAPQGHNLLDAGPNSKPDTVSWHLEKMTFCPPPRKTKGRDDLDCHGLWNQRQMAAGSQPWGRLGAERWKLFKQARGDDW